LKHYDERNNLSHLWDAVLLPNALPALAGIVLGIVLAFLIARGSWLSALAIVAASPAAVSLNKYPAATILLWFVLMPFLPVGNVPSPVLWVVHRALIPLGLGLNLLSRILRTGKHSLVSWGLAEWSMVIYMILAIFSVLTTIKSPLLYIYQLYDRMFVAFTAYWLARFWSPDARALKRFIVPVIIVAISEIVIGFWAKYAPHTLPSVWSFTRMGDRMSGTFSNPTPYAYTLILCMLLLFHYAQNVARGAFRVFLLFIFGAGMMCIFLTFTRGCWLSAIIVLIGLLIVYPKPTLVLIAIAVPIIASLAVTVLADEVVFAVQRLTIQETVDSRIVLAHAGKQMFYAKPILGWGFGSYDRYDWQFLERIEGAVPTTWDVRHGTSHNTYLTILAEMGVVGFLLQFLPLFLCFGATVRSWSQLPREGFWSRQLIASLWLSVVFYLISSQVIDMRFFWYQIGLFWLTLGLISSLVQTDWQSGAEHKDNNTLTDRSTDAILRGNVI